MGFYFLLLIPLAAPIVAVLLKLISKARGGSGAPKVRGTGLTDRFAGPPFDAGINRHAHVLRQGTHRDRPYVAFDYSFDQVVRNNQTVTMRFTVVAVATPGPCPDLSITPPTLTGEDVELESEQFNDAFQIQGDERFAYAVLHPGTMAWLLDDGRARRMPLTFGGGDLFTYAVGTAPPEHVEAMLEFLCDVLDRVPGFVWRA